MKSISLFLVLFLSFLETPFSQEISVVKGKFSNIEFSSVSLQSDENTLTGAKDEFRAIVMDSGKFEIQVEIYAPEMFYVLIDNAPVTKIFLCPGNNLTMNLDSAGLKFEGSTSDFYQWSQILDDMIGKYSLEYAENNGIKMENVKKQIACLFDLKEKNATQVNKLATDFSLTSCEYEFCKYRTEYAIYTFLWSDLLLRGYSLKSDVYQFIYDLPLNDINAAKFSLDYNNDISVYIFLKLRIENGWYEPNSFDSFSDTFNILYYNKIKTEIQNEDIRNITLTRKIINLLSTGSTSAESLVKKYINDCSDSNYKKIVFQYYNDYLNQKNFLKQGLKINELSGSLFEELKQYKGKVLYIDFWASWCGPCLADIPFTKKLQEKYQDQALEIIFVNIDDNIGNSETTTIRLGLKGNLIYLNKEQSTEIKKQLVLC
jgi:thiol-disulfide isomerase/thioredoxin